MIAFVGELPVLPRTNFNSSRLIRLLADLDIAGVAPSKQSFAEGLSLWLDWTDAIALHTVLSAAQNAARPTGAETGAAAPGRAVTEEFNRVRSHLAREITSDALFSAAIASATRHAPAHAAPAAPADGEPDFSPYRRRYLAHQRAMETRIVTLRADVRAALSAHSPELGSLAALDAVLDKALAARERHLLSTVPVLLGRHFERLRNAPQETTAQAREPNPAAPGGQTAPWLAMFSRQMQGVLLAELEMRLHPVEGMIEALETDLKAGVKTAARAQAPREATPQP